MKLYDGGRAPNPRRVRIFLAEKGLSVPTEAVDLGAREHKSAVYTAINPLQRVPALMLDDGTARRAAVQARLMVRSCHFFIAVTVVPSTKILPPDIVIP